MICAMCPNNLARGYQGLHVKQANKTKVAKTGCSVPHNFYTLLQFRFTFFLKKADIIVVILQSFASVCNPGITPFSNELEKTEWADAGKQNSRRQSDTTSANHFSECHKNQWLPYETVSQISTCLSVIRTHYSIYLISCLAITSYYDYIISLLLNSHFSELFSKVL